jgi:peptide subunit release factor 1 (eRF1)
MITRDEIRELAAFYADENSGAAALSFYFQPVVPQDRSHRNQTIVGKDVLKEALKEAAAKGKNGPIHADLNRILEVVSGLMSHSRGRAVFTCSARNFWKEFDLPPRLGSTRIFIQSRFQLRPLAALLGAQPSLCVAAVDRRRARLFDLRLDELRERADIAHALSRNGSDYGFKGYDAGHAERRVAEEAQQHFKSVAEWLRTSLEKGAWERLIVCCQDSNWPEFEAQLHPYVRQRLIGRFSEDVVSINNEEIRDRANAILNEWIEQRGRERSEEAIELAKANGRGVTGLRRVLRALETGEVQALFLADNYSAHAVECPHCGHLDAHIVSSCVACGHKTRELNDVCDAIIPLAIRRDIELFYLRDHEGLDRAGNIAALLRFRADQNRAGKVAIAS